VSYDEAWLATLKIEPLDPKRHDRAAFSCGESRIDNFLRNNAAKQAAEDFAKVYVAVEPPASKILGYYVLCAHNINIETLPDPDRKNMPRLPTVSAIYLSIVGVDAPVQKRGLGQTLTADALKKSMAAADHIGAYFVVLDALNEDAARMYRRLKFVDLPAPGQERRMLISMKMIRAASTAAP